MNGVLTSLLRRAATFLQWGPVGDNPQYPGTSTFLGLGVVMIGAVVTILGVRWLSHANSDDDVGYTSRTNSEGTPLSPVVLTVSGAVLLVAGVFLLLAAG